MIVASTLADDVRLNLTNSNVDVRKIHLNAMYRSLAYTVPLERAFDDLQGPMVEDLFDAETIKSIKLVVTNPKIKFFKDKFRILAGILNPLGYILAHAGTNRVVFQPQFDDSFVVKIGLDIAGRTNNPNEIVNQKYLKPFVCKCFDTTDDGVIGTFERVVPIENLYQLWSVREDIFDIMRAITKRFIIDDFGTEAFKNWGVRKGFGPVLLDYADMYILDKDTAYCRKPIDWHSTAVCGGELGYTPGYNKIMCKKCGGIGKAKQYKGKEKLSVYVPSRGIDMGIKCTIKVGGRTVFSTEEGFTNQINESKEEFVAPHEVVLNDYRQAIDDMKTETEKTREHNDEYLKALLKEREEREALKAEEEKKKNDAKVRIIVTANGVKVIRPEDKKEEPVIEKPIKLITHDGKPVNVVDTTNGKIYDFTEPVETKQEENTKVESKEIENKETEEDMNAKMLMNMPDIKYFKQVLQDRINDFMSEIETYDDKELKDLVKKLNEVKGKSELNKPMLLTEILPDFLCIDLEKDGFKELDGPVMYTVRVNSLKLYDTIKEDIERLIKDIEDVRIEREAEAQESRVVSNKAGKHKKVKYSNKKFDANF
jgi:hypothetical protein|nr:MAG TPA: hypothetical protein [Caudoviricetes sp.]